MHNSFLSFRIIVTIVLVLTSVYLGSRFVARFDWAKRHKKTLWVIFGVFIVIQMLVPFFSQMSAPPHYISVPLQWPGYSLLGVFAILFFYSLAHDLFLLLGRLFRPKSQTVDFKRRSFITFSGLALASSAIGTVQAVGGPSVKEVEIPIKDLPDDLISYKIVQITDLHIGPTIRREYVEKVVALANGLSPDLLALTGDFIDGLVPQLRQDIAPLKELKARHGMYFVTGNHEYYWGADEWIEEFGRMGIRHLKNEHVLIKQNETEFVLAGVTDIRSGNRFDGHASSPSKSVEGAPSGLIKILLAHNPTSYEEAFKAGFHLQLSGHTHGGQFFPFSLLMPIVYKYYRGLNKHENMWIYVSLGTGYWGPPQRFATPSEITLIKLSRA
jgi:predicted MPP superfamily phosphohydrolase